MKYQFQWLPDSGVGWYLAGIGFLYGSWYHGSTDALLRQLRRTLR